MSKFKVLWVDDQEGKCKRDIKAVKKIIESLGFEPDINIEDDISAESLTETTGALHKAICGRDIDLFVIDYNLKNNLFGSDVVKEIRSNNDIYTDIVFYSSMSENLIDAVRKSYESDSIMDFCDGVYIAPLGDEFIEKVQYVISKTIKSWYNVHSIRGVILSKASKFEQLVSGIIMENYEPCLHEIKEKLDNKGNNVCTTVKNKWEVVKKSEDPVQHIIDDPINFNWAVKKLMLEQIDESGMISVTTWDDINYIFDLRNKFAHNPLHLRNGDLVLTLKGKEEIYSEDTIERIRRRLARVEKELSKIYVQDSIGAKDFTLDEVSEKKASAV